MQKTYDKPGAYKIINLIRPLMVCTEDKYPATPKDTPVHVEYKNGKYVLTYK